MRAPGKVPFAEISRYLPEYFMVTTGVLFKRTCVNEGAQVLFPGVWVFLFER